MSGITIIRIIRGQEKLKECKMVELNQLLVENLRKGLLIRRSGVRIPPGVPENYYIYQFEKRSGIYLPDLFSFWPPIGPHNFMLGSSLVKNRY